MGALGTVVHAGGAGSQGWHCAVGAMGAAQHCTSIPKVLADPVWAFKHTPRRHTFLPIGATQWRALDVDGAQWPQERRLPEGNAIL